MVAQDFEFRCVFYYSARTETENAALYILVFSLIVITAVYDLNTLHIQALKGQLLL